MDAPCIGPPATSCRIPRQIAGALFCANICVEDGAMKSVIAKPMKSHRNRDGTMRRSTSASFVKVFVILLPAKNPDAPYYWPVAWDNQSHIQVALKSIFSEST